ncbi:MAG: DUF4129 domain-containing protein [Lewinellaceae bacterium]|nr:DUF4129 domain-containing protein [Lewinellaceae bacterium]
MEKYKYLVVLTLALGFTAPLGSSTPYEQYLEEEVGQRAFGQKDWEKATDGLSYDEPASRKKRREEAEKRRRQGDRAGGERYESMRRQSGSTMDSELAAIILKSLAILIIAVVLIILLRAMLGLEAIPRNKKIERKASSGSPINLEDIEDNIHESDLEAYIRQALAEGNHALAIRLYYLAILKELSLRKAIRWKKEKTNRHYLMEMQQSPLAGAFAEATLIFEQAWYGGRQVGESEYRQMEPAFRSLMEKAKG